MRVVKFGGTSVVNRTAFESCERLIEKARLMGPTVVVVSARAGVTNLLIELFSAIQMNFVSKSTRLVSEIAAKHEAEPVGEILEELSRVVESMLLLRDCSPQGRDRLLSFGERLSAHCIADILGEDAVPMLGSDAGIFTDECWGAANYLKEVTRYEVRRCLIPLLEDGKVPVIGGFCGITQTGAITTLGRGGSDLTATILASSLQATEVWLCSDVLGLLEADPRIADEPKLLERLTHREAVAMVRLGAKGIHPGAFHPALASGTPVRVRSSFMTDNEGTLITSDAIESMTETVRSFHVVRGVDVISLTARPSGNFHRQNIGEILVALLHADVDVLVVSQAFGESEVVVAIRASDTAKAVRVIETAGTTKDTRPTIELFHDAAIVAIVGGAIHRTAGTASRFLSALAAKGINVKSMAASTLSISAIIEHEETSKTALEAVRSEFRA